MKRFSIVAVLLATLYVPTAAQSWAVEQWGLPGDIPMHGFFHRSHKTDLVVYRPSTGTWFLRHLPSGEMFQRQWGMRGDLPLLADFDGDGSADFTVYRPSTGIWYILNSHTGYATSTSVQWGVQDGVPVPGDYNADGNTDIAIYQPATGAWWIAYGPF